MQECYQPEQRFMERALELAQQAADLGEVPCPMCCGAILHARIEDLIFGASDPKGGAVCSVEQMFELPYHYHPRIVTGMCADACSQILRDFFRALREQKKQQKQQAAL